MVLAEGCGCGSYNHDEKDFEGRVVLIERGECSFVSKAVKAQEAGALFAIIDDDDVLNDDIYLSMIDDETGRSPEIPTAFLLGKSGHMIRRTMDKLGLGQVSVNVAVNITSVPINRLNQPPWLVW